MGHILDGLAGKSAASFLDELGLVLTEAESSTVPPRAPPSGYPGDATAEWVQCARAGCGRWHALPAGSDGRTGDRTGPRPGTAFDCARVSWDPASPARCRAIHVAITAATAATGSAGSKGAASWFPGRDGLRLRMPSAESAEAIDTARRRQQDAVARQRAAALELPQAGRLRQRS